MKVIGFTGTRKGMTAEQKLKVAKLLFFEDEAPEVHHGGCYGADTDFHDIATKAKCKIVVHPGDEQQKYTFNTRAHLVLAVKPYLERNKDIVKQCMELIACPSGMHEEQRSGTWATIRQAMKLGRRLLIVWPDGKITRENMGAEIL